MQIIIDAISIMMQASIIAIAYIMIGIVWIIARQRIAEPVQYHNGIQVAAMLILWPASMILTAIQWIRNRTRKTR